MKKFLFIFCLFVIFGAAAFSEENIGNSNSIDIQIEDMVNKRIEQVLNKKSSEWGIGQDSKTEDTKKTGAETKNGLSISTSKIRFYISNNSSICRLV